MGILLFNTVFLSVFGFISVAVDDKFQSSEVFSSCHITASSGGGKNYLFDILLY